MRSNNAQNINLDLILDQALDDFEEQSFVEKVTKETDENLNKRKGEQQDNEVSNEKMLLQAKLLEQKKMEELLQSLQDPAYGATLQSTLKSLSSTTEGIQSVDHLFDNLAKQFEQQHKSSLYPDDANDRKGLELSDREVAATMQMIGSAQRGMEGFEPAKIEDTSETIMEEMISQFEELGEKEDYNAVIDGVMRQLLSKDLMYDPTKQICDKFPEWLATHRRSLSEAEYNNYGKQYQCFQKILAVYDTEPDNFPRLMELMFDLQQFGQPPAEIIKDLAPGLKFDENGMPIMPNMGAGMMPEGINRAATSIGMPGGEGLPNLAELSEQMASGSCILC